MDMNELKNKIDNIVNEHNKVGIPDFEGYSPEDIHNTLYFTFDEKSPVQLQRLSDSDCHRIPILMQIKYLADLIAEQGEIKLTKKGFLPVKFVKDIYGQGFLKERIIDSGIVKLNKEADSITVNLTRILAEISGIVKKRNNKLSLTKSGEKIISDKNKLLELIFKTFTLKFNWAYYDGYNDNSIAQFGFGFSLILLSKYGSEKRPGSFYAEKYFKAFPQLLNSLESPYESVEKTAEQCYLLRTFERFLCYFGLTSIEKENNFENRTIYITKTDLFDKFIKCIPGKNK